MSERLKEMEGYYYGEHEHNVKWAINRIKELETENRRLQQSRDDFRRKWHKARKRG